MGILHTIKRINQKTYIKAKTSIDPSFRKESTQQQNSAYLICKRLIEKEGTILTKAPISDKRYIKETSWNLFVIISIANVQIINHVYSYIIPMGGHILLKTIKAFDNKLEKTINEMELEITGNIQKSLTQIKDELSK